MIIFYFYFKFYPNNLKWFLYGNKFLLSNIRDVSTSWVMLLCDVLVKGYTLSPWSQWFGVGKGEDERIKVE
jgi:hypothetical protein